MKLLSCEWIGDESVNGKLRLLDQRHLPLTVNFIECSTVNEIFDAIRNMTVRGAPAIGVAGAYSMALDAFSCDNSVSDASAFIARMKETKKYIDSSRPTAVNLEWATDRIVKLVEYFASENYTVKQLQTIVIREAHALAEQDIKINRAIGAYGASLVPKSTAPEQKPFNIVHHCNTGSLATVDHGTALGVIFSTFEENKNIHVWVDETRPRLQGAKLTAFELKNKGIPFDLVVDGCAGHLMYENKVDMVVFGADRVAANGDVANKIGTMTLSVCAREFGVPTYACVPTPTIDLGIASGREIVIEQRDIAEITNVGQEQITVNDCTAYNPAFDVTPAKYLTGIITEEGICYPPFTQSLAIAKHKAEERVRKSWEDAVAKYKSEL